MELEDLVCDGIFDVGLVSAVSGDEEFFGQTEGTVGKLEQLFHLEGC